jgi:hypothetical protein
LLQTKEEKRATREQNPASGRRIEGDGARNKDGDGGADHVISKKLVINPNNKKDKYAGMSRAKRRRYDTPRARDLVHFSLGLVLDDTWA